MQKSFLKLLTAALVATSLLMSVPTAFAQSITTSSLNGTIQTEQGQPVSGAAVTVTHQPTGLVYNATSRTDGTFVLRGLRPGGPYSVSVAATGYTETENSNVFLDIDRGADLSFRLKATDVVQLEKFTVIASSTDLLFDTKQTGSGTYFNSNDIRNLPSGDRSINSLARMDPRITYNRDPFDRAISANGLSNRFNSIQVDGVSANDPFGLNANNTAAERNVVPMDSLDAISISTSPYMPRNGGFVGAQVNAITKSGGNDFHGSLYYTYRGRTLFGKDMVGQKFDNKDFPIANFSEETMGATLNGPIIPKKLFFSLSYEKVDELRVAPSPVTLLPQDTIAQIAAAATALGFKPGSATPPAGNKLTDKNIIAKFDWQINANHRATFRYNDVKSSRPTFPGFGSGISENNFSFDSYWYQQIQNNKTYLGQLISRWSDKLNTEISVSRSKYHSEPQNNSRQPNVQIRNIVVPGSSNTSFVTFGTELSRHANILDVQTDTAELFSSYELTSNQTLQAGIQFDSADTYNLFVQNANGNYDFNSLADFLAVAALNNGTINYRQYTYNQILSGVEPAARFNEKNLGVFLNDSWRVRSNLTLDLGLRLDRAMLPDAVPYNASFDAAFGMRNDYTYDGQSILQPRIGFNWQPDLKGKRTIIRGGVGLFYGRAPRVWISNSYSNTGSNFRTWTAGTTPGGQAPIVSANPDTQATTSSGLPAQTVAFMKSGFKLPSRYKANIAIEQEVGFWGLKATAEIENTWVKDDVFYRNINLQATGTAADGRLQYFNAYAAPTVNATTGAVTGGSSGTRLVNTGFTNRTIMLSNTGSGGTQAISFSLERPRTKSGWTAKVSYVNTHATETLFGTSSVAASNWNNRSVFNVNAQEEHRSELEVRDRIIVTVSKEMELIKGYRTTFSVFYEGRSGYPFSFVYTTDANGDSQTQNDLAYIPTRSGDTRVRFAPTVVSGVVTATATENQDAFFRIVDRFGLQEGQAVSANSNRYPWVNQFDFTVKQDIKLPGWKHKLVLGADILNVGNLLNQKWGVIRGSNQFFAKKEGIAAALYDGATNQYVYSGVNTNLANGVDFSPALGRGEPAATRWTVLFTARYEF